jgi:hypothetical protein
MKGFMMKKLFVLLALACCLSIGCKPSETTPSTDPAPTADGTDDSATDGTDDSAAPADDSADAGS